MEEVGSVEPPSEPSDPEKVTGKHDSCEADRTGTKDACCDAGKTRGSSGRQASPMYYRIFEWCILVQQWETLRFDDHKGTKPSDFSFTGGSKTARVTRSKSIGSDRNVSSSMVYVYACCHIVMSGWTLEGWAVLETAVDHQRDYFQPSPASNCNGCLRSELRYDFAHRNAEQSASSLTSRKSPILPRSSTTFWTSHSSHTFLPSCHDGTGSV